MLTKNISSLLFSVLLAAAASLLLNRYSPLITHNWPYSLAYFAVLCFAFNLGYAWQARQKPLQPLMLAGIVIKLLLALIIILIYAVVHKPGFFNFSVHFILHYILFTIFEIRYLLQLIKKYPPT